MLQAAPHDIHFERILNFGEGQPRFFLLFSLLDLLVRIHLDILGEWVYLRYLECLPSQGTVESITHQKPA
jgi:hypothetical protein